MYQLIHRIIRYKSKLLPLDYVILFILVIIIASYIFVKLNRRSTWIPITVRLGSEDISYRGQNPEPWYAYGLSIGQASYSSLGVKIAQITDINNLNTESGKNEMFITMNVKATYDKKNKTYSFNFQPLAVGSPYKAIFETQNIQGIITYVGDNRPYVDKTIEAKLLYIYPWVADAVKNGLQIKDSTGRVVAEIEKVSIQNSEGYEIKDQQDRVVVIQSTDITKRDVTIKLKLKTKEYYGTYYFAGKPVKIGNGIRLEFPDVTAQNMEISQIFD